MSVASVVSSRSSELSEHLWNEKRDGLRSVQPDFRRAQRKPHRSRGGGSQTGYAARHQQRVSSQPNQNSTRIPQKSRLPRIPDSDTDGEPRVIDNTNYRNYLKKRYPRITRAKEADDVDYGPQSVHVLRPPVKKTSTNPPHIKKPKPKPDTWPGDREASANNGRQSQRLPVVLSARDNQTLQSYTYLVEHHRFAWEFTEEFIYAFLDDEMIPDVLIETVTAAMSQEKYTARRVHYEAGDHAGLARECVDRLIQETLEEEIIPDVLIETFRELQGGKKGSKKTALKTPRMPMEAKALEIMHSLMREVLPDEIRAIVTDEVVQQSNSILARLDVVEMTSTFLLDGVIHEECVSVVRQALAELANEEVGDAAKFDVLNDVILEVIKEHAVQLVEESRKELVLDDALDESVIGPELENMCREVANDVLEYYDNKLRRKNLLAMQRMGADKPLALMALDHMLSVVQYDSQAVGYSRQLHRHLEATALEHVLREDDRIRRDRDYTLGCQPMRVMNQRAVADVAMEVMLDELVRHENEDLCDLDCDEVKDPDEKRYIYGTDVEHFGMSASS